MDELHGAVLELVLMTLFVFFGCTAAIAAQFAAGAGLTAGVDVLLISFAFGFMILVLVSGFGSVSGGHINPAVTLALMMAKVCEVKRGIFYMLAQFAGALLGALLCWGATYGLSTSTTPIGAAGPLSRAPGNPPYGLGVTTLNPWVSQLSGFILEMMGTVLLCMTVLMVAVHKGNPFSPMAPHPIGFAVFVAHLALVPFTGCGINPARTFGPAVVAAIAGHEGAWGSWSWIYFIGPFTGSAVSVAIYRVFKGFKHFEERLEEQQPGTEVGNKVGADSA